MSRKATIDKTPRVKPSAATGRFSYEGLDRVLHEKARLGILASLAANPDGLRFNDLKQLCALPDGNLSRHLTVLHEAGLLETWKGATGPRPQTKSRLPANGQQRFAEYISVLEQVVADAQRDTQPATTPPLSKRRSPA